MNARIQRIRFHKATSRKQDIAYHHTFRHHHVQRPSKFFMATTGSTPSADHTKPRNPKFQVGELVHLKWSNQNPSAMVKEADESPGSAQVASIERPRPCHLPSRERVTEYKAPEVATNVALRALTRPELVWRIEGVQLSSSDQEEHSYTLVPHQPMRLKTIESSIWKAPFQVSDLAVAKKDRDRIFKVERLKLYEQGTRVEVVDEIGIYEWLWANELERAPGSATWNPM